MKVAFVGSGLQTRRRAPVVHQSPDDELVVIAGTDATSRNALAAQFGCEATDDWHAAVGRSDIDAVVVTTPPHLHAEISVAALESGKHVLCEKPLSRTLGEAQAMVDAAARAQRVLKCGFNHRHHPAILEARRRFEQGDFGRPISGRCRYGICGRPGYENEWRADPARAAGGQYAEQGVHAIDLFRWFLGDLTEVSCMTAIGYFDKQPLEDNGMALFRSAAGALAMLHASLTQWENLFSFEILGDEGYFSVEGLGATYGTEKLYAGKRDFTAPFQDHVIQYRGGDSSWQSEWNEFKAAIREGRRPLGDGADGLEAVRATLASYQAEATRTVVDLRTFAPTP
ncbi:MAG: Gfo/Idh/MocA family oxidoreductase [Candidatus Lustribacter sp.]